jgi:hypothetical protein
MTKRSFLAAAVVAALSFVGTSAQAAFTYSTTTTPLAAAVAGVTFTFVDQPATTVPGTVGIPNVNINSSGTNVGTGTFNMNTVITVTVNGVSGFFTETASYTVSDGVYQANSVGFTGPTSIVVDGSVFTISTPQATSGTVGINTNNGAISARIQQTVVPEPASLAMVGLGLASVGGLALRRRVK